MNSFFVFTAILSILTYFVRKRTLSHAMVFTYVAAMLGSRYLPLSAGWH